MHKKFLKVIKRPRTTCRHTWDTPRPLRARARANKFQRQHSHTKKVAVIHGEKFDPAAGVGAGRIAENILQRTVKIAKSAPLRSLLEMLRSLDVCTHIQALVADLYYKIRLQVLEISGSGIDERDRMEEVKSIFDCKRVCRRT